jgi:hypothetical protein
VIIAHALSWIPHSSFDFGDVTAGEGVAMFGASLLAWLLIHAMTEMAKKLRNTKRECEMLRRSLVEAKRPVRQPVPPVRVREAPADTRPSAPRSACTASALTS